MVARVPRKSGTKDETIGALPLGPPEQPVMAYRKRVEVQVIDLISDPK
jgi:hypothetical protein